MERFIPFLKNRILLLVGFVSFLITGWSQTQLPECNADVPFFILDLSNNPDSTYISPEIVRTGQCCGDAINQNYVSFYVTLNPNVAMIEIGIAPGYADPGGSGFYNVVSGGNILTPGICGPNIPGGTPTCLTGPGPHKITYHKPGGNKVKYYFHQIPRPIFPTDQTTRVGCTKPMQIYGLNNISISAINSSAGTSQLATYTSYMSCTNCATPTFSPGTSPTYPYWIDYKICGTPQASACGVFQSCDTIRITIYQPLEVTVNPNPAQFCTGGSGVTLNATATGGFGTYTYTWRNSSGGIVGTGSTFTTAISGSYTVEVSDGLNTSTCPSDYLSVNVTEGNPPLVNAGPDKSVCATNPAVNLGGVVQFAAGAYWTGGNGSYITNDTTLFGTFANSPTSVLTTYMPTLAEMNAGSVTLTLHTLGAAGGCGNISDAITIYFPDTLQVNVSASAIPCYGGTSTLLATATGGSGGYSYVWSNGDLGNTSTISSGTYSVLAVDALGCSAVHSISVTQPSTIQVVASSTNTSTDVACDGSASVSISGGTAPYTVLWSNGQTTTTTTSTLCYGSYGLTITDANGCSITTMVVVNKPSCSSFNASATGTSVTCYGGNNGTASATAVGGTAPYTYSWNTTPPQTTATANLLSTGTYTVFVTDAGGCIDASTVTIMQPNILTNTITHIDVTSVGGTNGSATANPLGGTPGYTYQWMPGGMTTQTIANLSSAPGGVVYYLNITDSRACTISDSVLINEPPCNEFMIAVNTVGTSCNGASNGSATVVVGDGVGPYTLTWSTGATGLYTINNLSAGNYSVTVTDAMNCTTFQSFVIQQPNPLTISLTPTNITCSNAQDGTVDLTIVGGTGPYTFAWSFGGRVIASYQDLVNLGPGTYSVVVVDANGCTVSGSIGITQPTPLSSTYTYTDALCFGNTNGTINATPSGGTLPYVYAWDGPGTFTASTQDLSGLSNGLYELQLSDANGCDFGPMQVYINQPALLVATIAIADSVSCGGQADGILDLTTVGGTPSYTYLWSGPSSYTSTSQDPTGLLAGGYLVTVTDQHGCTATASRNLPTVPDITKPLITCPGNQSSTTASTSCTYTQIGAAWNASATDNCQMATLTAVLTGATSATGLTTLNNVQFNKGITTVTWTAADASGNTATCFYTVTVSDATAPVISSCGGSGIVSVNTNPGNCSYTVNGISWNPTATDNCGGVLTANYTMSGATIGSGVGTLNNVSFNLGFTTVLWTVTDVAGNASTCQFQVNVTDNQAPSITCVTGGPFTVPSNTGTCTYTQTSNAWNASASDLCAGTVSVSYTLSGATTGTGTSLNGQVFNSGTTQVLWTATDFAGNTSTCSFNVTVTDTQNPIILTCGPSTTPIVNVNAGLCTYTKSGTGWNPTISDNCGTYTMNYTLSGATTGTGTSLSGVQFNLGTTTISWLAADGNGNTATCTFQVNVVDTQLPIFTDCGPIGNQQVDLDAGECNYTVQGSGWDANASDNCSVASITYTLTGATTGTGTSLQNVNFNLGLTTVLWTASDASGNFTTCSFQVLVRDMQYPSITNCSALNTQVLPGNQGVCTYTNTSSAWNAIATDNCTVSQLTYTLSGVTTGTGTSLIGVIFNPGTTNVLWTATDIAGNSVTCSFSVQVTDNQAPIITNCPNDILVNSASGQCDTQVTWTAPGFSDNCGATMTVNIPSGSIFPIGTTSVVYTATDGSGNYTLCSFTVTVTDNQVPIITCPPSVTSCDPIISYAFPTAIDNCGIQSVLQVSGTLGSTGYPIGTTTDVYMATDIHGNTATCAVDVTVYEIPSMNVGVSQVSCYGLNDAVIDLIPFNGAPPYTYQWNNAWTQEDLFGIPAGTYSVEISDIHGCSRDTSITVSQPDPLALESSQDEVLCAAGSNGSIALSVFGGTDPYNFNWSNESTESQVNELSAGTYSTVITDANGCVINFETTLTEPDTLALAATIEDAACNAPNGAILVEVSGGIAPYNYQWSDGSATVNLINVPHGIYSLEVTDLNGCSVYYMDTIQSLNNLNAYSVINNATCFGDTNGQINVFVRTGSGPFTFEWSDGNTGAINDSLAAGDYSVLITDLYGCQAIVTASITQPDSMTLLLGSPMFTGGYNVSATGGNDGSILATVNGGTSPYIYLWSNGETTPSIHDLNEGIYSVIVTDENGCPIYGTIRLSEPDVLEMPNGFSPNGDSDNEYFVIHGLDAYPENHFVVYNRWGNIVYEKPNYENEWHGVNNTGEVLPDGTYFVILTVNKGGEEKALSGYVDMRRTH